MVENCPGYIDKSCPISQLLLNGVFTTISVIFGLLGSVASLIFIKRHYRCAKKAHHKNTLEMLVIWDMILLVGAFGYYGLWNLFRCHEAYFDPLFAYLLLIFHPVINTAFTASSCLIVLVSVDKFLGVSMLLSRKKQKKLLEWTRTYMCYLVSVFVILLNIPVYFEGKIGSCFNPDTNVTQYLWRKTVFRENWNYIFYYHFLVLGITFTSLGPFLTIIGLSFATVTCIYKSYRVRLSMQRSFNNDKVVQRHSSVVQVHSIVATEFLLITKFVVSHTIPACLDMWEATTFDKTNPKQLANFMYFIYVSNFLVILNSATNCLAYLKCGRALYGLMARTFKNYTAGEPLFSRQEVALLKRSWHHLVVKSHNRFGRNLLLRNLADSNRFTLIQFWESGDSTPTNDSSLEVDPDLVGEKITNFFHKLFANLSENSTRLDICGPIRHVGFVHRRENVQISSAMWNRIKYWILTKVNEATSDEVAPSGSGAEATNLITNETDITGDNVCEIRQRAWEKLICVIISEMKIGYLSTDVHNNYRNSPSDQASTPRSRCYTDCSQRLTVC